MRVTNLIIDKSLPKLNKDISNNNDFSGTLNNAYKSKTKDELEDYVNQIKKIGNRLIITQNYIDVMAYKNVIKDYLKSVVEYMYSINKNVSFWDTQYFTTVDTINNKLEELTKEIVYGQKENIDVAATIDNIQGLLVDIYK